LIVSSLHLLFTCVANPGGRGWMKTISYRVLPGETHTQLRFHAFRLVSETVAPWETIFHRKDGKMIRWEVYKSLKMYKKDQPNS